MYLHSFTFLASVRTALTHQYQIYESLRKIALRHICLCSRFDELHMRIYTYAFNKKMLYITILHSPTNSVQWVEALSSCNNPCLYRTSISCSCLQYCTKFQGFHFHLIEKKLGQKISVTHNARRV